MTSSPSPEALLFIATGCQHCPSVLQSLGELVKSGVLGKLEVINIQQHPEIASEYNVRSVPWVKMGPFELTGLRSKSELEQWLKRVDDPAAMGDYFSELMTSGEINKVQEIINNNPDYFSILLELMASPDTTLSVRIGVGAVIEDFSGGEILKNNIDALGEYTRHKEARVRNDACHYLSLSETSEALKYIKPLLKDDDAEVREVAEEAIEELS